MAHEIIFDGVYNSWNNALPLGNGKMGAMVFFENHELHIALNHYDHYYKDVKSSPLGKKTYKEYRDLVDKARESENYQHSHYIDTLNPNAKNNRPKWSTTSYPMAGEIVIPICDTIEDFTLRLIIEEGVVMFESPAATVRIWIAASKDCLFVEGLWEDAKPLSEKTTQYETSFTVQNDCLVATVIPENHNDLLQIKDALAAEHAAHWRNFWRAKVQLPDYFLETLWYLHLYNLGCASGIGGRYFHQACGLNGLWDIRRPNLWASTWYWDVNIQEAFWPVFSANQLELAKHFCDAYLSYADKIQAYTQAHYGYDGWALDYPHMLYHCIQPWCAQFLWRYYSYSGDIEFLREKAYPVFVKQIEHYKRIATKDGHIMYDISPEQGPITQDSVATIATIKQLLKYTIKAAKILNRSEAEVNEYTCLHINCPDYPTTADGTRLKDSSMAPDDLFFRHPSILMPIFPCEEELDHNLALETLKYASENTEIGVFGAGWLASAAAKLGEGTAALRLLYEKGIDYFIHSNGLGYEESERYVNHCLITKPPLYPPAMMEPSGGIVMAVNQMLLKDDDIIEVFPAIPDGTDNLATKKLPYRHQNTVLQGNYLAWDNCRFDGMLAAGGFEVSAQRANGETTWIHIKSNQVVTLKLCTPEGIIEKEMTPGEEFTYGTPQTLQKNTPRVQTRQSPTTRRRIFIGEDRHTDFYRKIDSFVCPYLLGSTHQYQMLPYIFDFGDTTQERDYDKVFHKAFCISGRSIVFMGAPRRVGLDMYDENIGYGFSSLEEMTCEDFIEGTMPIDFVIKLPRGKYNALIISIDEEKTSQTHINLPHIGGKIEGKVIKPGKYQCQIIPFMQETDGLFRIGLSSDPGHKWTLNAIFLAKEYYS
ncbi:MAG: glycoside hydrolase family 95 protein [Defluviitaleaceae bacterium]|nr:glycoside hydrolase family 95 protein [Defluviitaleaceae bacterium]